MEIPNYTPTSPHLTPREQDVLRLVLAGHTDKQIADDLGISPRTASHHVASIIHKLGAETRAGVRRWVAGSRDAAIGAASASPPSIPADPGISRV